MAEKEPKWKTGYLRKVGDRTYITDKGRETELKGLAPKVEGGVSRTHKVNPKDYRVAMNFVNGMEIKDIAKVANVSKRQVHNILCKPDVVQLIDKHYEIHYKNRMKSVAHLVADNMIEGLQSADPDLKKEYTKMYIQKMTADEKIAPSDSSGGGETAEAFFQRVMNAQLNININNQIPMPGGNPDVRIEKTSSEEDYKDYKASKEESRDS